MRPRRSDALLLVLVGLVVVAALLHGARHAARGAPRNERFARALSVHAGVDPLAPPGLPQGASVDPETGWLVGLDLAPGARDTVLDWSLLQAGNEATSLESVPAAIRALEGRRVVIAGFQLALYELRAMREFLLVGSHYTCCFGTPPGFGDQVTVRLDPSAEPMDATAAPVRVAGTFRIKPQHLYEDGTGPLIALFEIVAARARAYDG